MNKPIDKIKFGSKILAVMQPGSLYFVADIKKSSHLDDKSLKSALEQLRKHGYIQKNDRSQWSLVVC